MINLKQIEKVLKEVLLFKPKEKTKYENKKLAKVEKNQKWLLDERVLKIDFADLGIILKNKYIRIKMKPDDCGLGLLNLVDKNNKVKQASNYE